jgi:hypothetical protein
LYTSTGAWALQFALFLLPLLPACKWQGDANVQGVQVKGRRWAARQVAVRI